MATPDNLLELAIDELRRNYDKLSNDFDQVRIKILTLLGGSLALLAFLYSDGHLFIPNQIYGQIFYVVGAVGILGGTVTLFWASRPSYWALPAEEKELTNLEARYKNKNEFLVYLKKEYLEAVSFCKSAIGKKVVLLDIGANMVFVGAIILLVIKFFGGK